MLKIGDFSKLSRISVRMLRHYDELSLLKPASVDKFTGYRYYDESQLLIAERIQVLRNMGFSIAEIESMLKEYDDSDKIKEFLYNKKSEIQSKMEQLNNRIQLLDGTIEWLRKDRNIMGYDVVLKTFPQRYVASVRQIIQSYDQEGVLWQTLMGETETLNMKDGSPCYTLAIFHDDEFKETDVDVEVQKTVTGKYSDTENVKFKTVPAVEIASATFQGSYEQTGAVNQAVAQWIADNGYVLDGSSFSIYHKSPYETQNPDEFITEICYPVKKC